MSQFKPFSAQAQEPAPEPAPLLVREESPAAAAAASLAPAAGGALVAALVGGIVWAGVAIETEYEVGFLAWGLGFLSGYAVLTFAGGRRGPVLQVVAALGAVLGIFVGKYIAYVHFLKALVQQQLGSEFADQISYLDTQVVRFFFHDLGSVLSGFDVVWVLLAVLTAWRIPRLAAVGGRAGSV